MDLRRIVCCGMDWIDLAPGRDQWRAVTNMLMNRLDLQCAVKFFNLRN
jgi:hypothetical protein